MEMEPLPCMDAVVFGRRGSCSVGFSSKSSLISTVCGITWDFLCRVIPKDCTADSMTAATQPQMTDVAVMLQIFGFDKGMQREKCKCFAGPKKKKIRDIQE